MPPVLSMPSDIIEKRLGTEKEVVVRDYEIWDAI